MKRICLLTSCCIAGSVIVAIGCSPAAKKAEQPAAQAQQPALPAFHVDLATAGSISGTIRYIGPRPAPKKIDMSEDPACVAAHQGKAIDESLVVSPKGALGNAFIYIKAGLEGKRFETPSTPITIDQKGCWFRPRVLGIQTGQTLEVINSDPVTHNIHPMAQINREWNHSQGAGDAPLARRFIKPEVMIRVKCNIHSWMRAFIGAVDNPYFAVSKDDGSYTIQNLPPGTYTLGIWQENLGTQEQQVTVLPHANTSANITFQHHL
jgi:plastocyanin